MSELTKCWLQQAIAGIETIRDDMPFGLDEDEQKTLAALKMALAVLDVKPFAAIGDEMLEEMRNGRKTGRIWGLSEMCGSEPESLDALYVYTTPPAPRAPDGWKLVPLEPHWSMIDAAIKHHEGEAFLPVSLYKAMLAAAPAPEV